jgi:hypothetical protein
LIKHPVLEQEIAVLATKQHLERFLVEQLDASSRAYMNGIWEAEYPVLLKQIHGESEDSESESDCSISELGVLGKLQRLVTGEVDASRTLQTVVYLVPRTEGKTLTTLEAEQCLPSHQSACE